MSSNLIWGLERARRQTLALVTDVVPEQMCLQAQPGEHHPAWILGHLLLADTYLLSLLEVQDLSADFAALLRRYGPEVVPTPSLEDYPSKEALTEELTHVGSLRLDAVRELSGVRLERPLPDPRLAETQPTIAHHLQALVFHEGYHSGELSSWRRARGLPPVPWIFAPPS